MEKDINIIKRIEQMSSSKSSTDLFKRSFEAFRWKRDRVKRNIVLVLICIIPSYSMGVSEETKNLFCDSLGDILGVFLAILGIVFTGYALFQAIINDELLIKLLEIKSRESDNQSKLQETNESFAMLMMQNLMIIILSLVLKMTIRGVNDEFLVLESIVFSNILAIILMVIFYFVVAVVLCELKSFIFNIYQLFNLSSVTRILELIQSNKK